MSVDDARRLFSEQSALDPDVRPTNEFPETH
jgi:hypothetical protein